MWLAYAAHSVVAVCARRCTSPSAARRELGVGPAASTVAAVILPRMLCARSCKRPGRGQRPCRVPTQDGVPLLLLDYPGRHCSPATPRGAQRTATTAHCNHSARPPQQARVHGGRAHFRSATVLAGAAILSHACTVSSLRVRPVAPSLRGGCPWAAVAYACDTCMCQPLVRFRNAFHNSASAGPVSLEQRVDVRDQWPACSYV